MVDLVCQKCGRPFNLGEDVYRRRKSRGEPDLCATHWAIRQNLRRREKLVVCGICGAQFQSNVAEWIERSEAKKPMVCPQCANVTVTCSRCGRTYQEKRERVEELRTAACRFCARIASTSPSPVPYASAVGNSSGPIGTGWRPAAAAAARSCASAVRASRILPGSKESS